MTTFIDEVARWGLNLNESEELDAWSSEWADCKAAGAVWGGRSRGGRGIRQRISTNIDDISVEGVTLAFCGKQLLQNAR